MRELYFSFVFDKQGDCWIWTGACNITDDIWKDPKQLKNVQPSASTQQQRPEFSRGQKALNAIIQTLGCLAWSSARSRKNGSLNISSFELQNKLFSDQFKEHTDMY